METWVGLSMLVWWDGVIGKGTFGGGRERDVLLEARFSPRQSRHSSGLAVISLDRVRETPLAVGWKCTGNGESV